MVTHMHKVFELWLDESGEFQNEKELQRRQFKPSLIGGFLVEQERVDEIAFDALIDEERTHAMHFANSDKRDYVLPILEKMQKEYGAKEVFFENLEYEDAATNRQLYLRIMSEGLLQLMLTLNARYESVSLQVLIAQRQDSTAPVENRRIAEEEYLAVLKKCIAQKKREHKAYLDEDSILAFDIQPAYCERKLQLADFACNTRLTRDSRAFENVRERVSALYEDAYLFTLTEVGSQNYIKQSLVQEHFADAIMELYTTRDVLNHTEELEVIIARMKQTDYRLVKSEMEQCASRLSAYTVMEDDYEVGEAILNALRCELVPLLRANGQPHCHFHFTLLLQLASMYLQEGDIVAAEDVICECREIQRELGVSLEEVYSYYQLVKKEAQLAIASYAYDRAGRIMEEACESLREIMQSIMHNPVFQDRFPKMKSAYYGDALGIQIQALMLRQKEKPESYEKAVQLSEEALGQYKNTEGELECHRQYRCRIELNHGNYEAALLWLIQSKLYSVKEVTQQTIREFLAAVSRSEDEMDCSYFLMYYLLIMVDAKKAKHPLGELMYRMLWEEKELLQTTELMQEEAQSDYGNVVDMDEIKETESGIHYHPKEIVFWKYASYLYTCGKYKEALPYYTGAVKMCFRYKNYQTMLITGLGIAAERICCLEKLRNQAAVKYEYRELQNMVQEILKQRLNSSTKGFVKRLEECLESARGKHGEVKVEMLWKLIEKLPY